MAEKAKPVYKFGPFRIARADGLLTRNGRAIRLTPKSFELLLFMVENRGRLLDKETLLASIWPDSFVEESSLTKNVFLLRRCLGEGEDGRPYIETFPRRGYRFDADVHVEAIAELPHPTRALRGDTPDKELGILVGRDRELRILESLMEQTTRGNGKIVLLIGEAGIGKTALAESFLASVRRRYPDILIAKGVCVQQYGAGEAYLPFLEALNLLVTTYTRERVLAPLGVNAPTWCLHLPAAVSSAERERMHYETIGATKERMLREMGDFLSVITSETPVVLLLEDLHWADTSSADLLRSLGHRISTERLLVMGTYRPEDLEIKNHSLRNYARELVAHGVCEEIPLEALNRGDIVVYLNTRFSPNDFPAEMAALIAQKTEGYPLFVSGLAELLIQRGDIAWRDGCWTLTRPAEFAFEVPRTVVSIIRNRLDRLEDRDRRALEYAAIEGEEFGSRILSALLETEEITVEEQMDRLEKVHRLVRRLDQEELPDGSLAIRYRFAHALYQNTLYEELVPGRRVALHRRAGEELLQLHVGQESHVAAQLAMHFERARDFSRAVKYLLDMGDNASHLYDNMAALLHYSRALELTEKLPAQERSGRRLLTYQKRGAAQMALGRLAEAREDLRLAVDQARAMQDATAECLALNALANSLIPSHKLTDLAAAATEAMKISERIGSQPFRAEAMTNLGLFSMASGSLRESGKLLSRSTHIARACEHTSALIPALTYHGLLHNFRSEYERAEGLEKEASTLASNARDGFHLPLSLFYLGIIQANLGRLSEALATLTRALEMARRNGNRVVLSRIPNAMGWIYRELRDIPKAIEYDRMSAETAQQMKLSEAEAHALINLGHDYALVGETGLAMTGLQDAERLLERDPWYRWRFFDIRLQDAAAQVCLRQRKLDEAHRQATHLLVNATRYEAPKYMALARNALAEVAFAAGEYERAATEVRTGLAGLQRHPAPLVAWKSWGILGRALGYLGDNEGARQAFAESAAIVKTILANIDDQRLCEKLLSAPDVCAVFAGEMK